MLQGRRTWRFENSPRIISVGTAVGPKEGKGPLGDSFDVVHGDIRLGQNSWENAERVLMEEAGDRALQKKGLVKEQVEFYIAGDLMNQVITSSFAARTFAAPYLGIYGACSTSMEGLALAALLVNSQSAELVLTGTASHNAAAERLYRYPTEYGAQKPPTAQWTVTGAGAALVGRDGEGPKITAATIGRIIDMGVKDPFNMGAAMAPAAFDTIEAHLRDLNVETDYYDIIATGDLGRLGSDILRDLWQKHGVRVAAGQHQDCGVLIYGDDPSVFSGGSGAACSAVVTYGHLLARLAAGEWNRILIVATGALLSTLSYQQGESIPCIAHAVAIERA